MNRISEIKKKSKINPMLLKGLIPIQLSFNIFNRNKNYRIFCKSLWRILRKEVLINNVKIVNKYDENSKFQLKDTVGISKQIEKDYMGNVFIYFEKTATINTDWKYFCIDCKIIDRGEDDYSEVLEIDHLYVQQEFTGKLRSSTWGKDWLKDKLN